ncbi:MAG TPA: PaaI family thioesterase [Kofleriaceae bacterium]|nr:PaaI family thioesterase [Kofleriaceae bacterium]
MPHNRALGLEMVALEDGEARMRLPYSPDLIGNPETGVLHGGAITSLMDACCGAAVFMKLTMPVPIATLDLRIDYLRPAAAGREVLAHATCFRLTRNVAFVRGVAYHDDEADPIAAAAGAFMLATSAGRARAP